ncbi:unnamed protein product [Mucor circinelloides]|uniref:AB hydrolase-1 domain-containing protein n=1 Tax=Mucor circinelloides f. circinelloides (strain 1006PhL) TaxID=1220926 RepID=S2JQL4_MUCC1|nr:hypothetical protein HMPREF1544_02375 [Mucor circinelloides 1006PhL]KAG1123363.1 hypothetical protein G6F42_010621 [Rhizopus arrhizus]
MYLKPTSTHVIPVHPSSAEGWATQKLVVDQHDFPGRHSNKKVAFLFNHASGFHKEILHPVMRRLMEHLRSLREYDQTDITFISWDERNHGDSARLNEGYLSEQYRMSDNAMDTKQVIDVFGLNTAKYDQFIGISHSMGSTTMLLCEYYYPGTFDGLCLVEPIISGSIHDSAYRSQFPVMAAAKRIDEWRSIDECRKSLTSKGFFKSFHSEALNLYLNHGLYETTYGTVKIKCPKQLEYIIYKHSTFETYICKRSLELLTIPVHVVFGDKSMFNFPELNGSISEKDSKMLTLDTISGTHMLPCENPQVLIPHIMRLINKVNGEPENTRSKL